MKSDLNLYFTYEKIFSITKNVKLSIFSFVNNHLSIYNNIKDPDYQSDKGFNEYVRNKEQTNKA